MSDIVIQVAVSIPIDKEDIDTTTENIQDCLKELNSFMLNDRGIILFNNNLKKVIKG